MRALICGIGGQDGCYLAKLLIEKGYEVIGSSRDAQMSSFSFLKELGIFNEIEKISMSITDYGSVLKTIKNYHPNEIYNLAGQSSVGLSFDQPLEAIDSITKSTLIILEIIKSLDLSIKFYNAGSSECFGNTFGLPADEKTNFMPCSPYGIAKAAAHWLVQTYRSSYGISACTGILFNHESPLRPKRFVTQKIIQSALNIKKGRASTFSLGNLETIRDWGWAPEYVEAMWLMLQQNNYSDYVIASGKSYSLAEFTEKVFNYFSLNWKDYLVIDKKLIRPLDISKSLADPSRVYSEIGWKSKVDFDQIILNLCEYAEKKDL